MDEDAPRILKVLHERARGRMLEEGKELLEWSRTLDEHMLPYQLWKSKKEINNRISNCSAVPLCKSHSRKG